MRPFSLESRGVTWYFVDNEHYFARPRLYGEFDDGERFAFFSKAVIDLMPSLDWMPDVLHCNDWQTALVPIYLKDVATRWPEVRRIRHRVYHPQHRVSGPLRQRHGGSALRTGQRVV